MVGHEFTPYQILSCLELATHLRPSAHLKDALAAAVPLIVGPAGSALANRLRDGTHILPNIDLMRMARVRLDFMSIMFERQLFTQLTFRRYIMVDVSSAAGFNFLCAREGCARFPRGSFGAYFRKAYDINAGFEARLSP